MVARAQERELFAFRHWKIAGLIGLRPPRPTFRPSTALFLGADVLFTS